MNALVTGASSGIGKEMAILLAARGYHVVLVARRLAELEQLALACPYGATPLAIDLSRPDAARQLIESTEERGLAIEVLINNAGFGRLGDHVTTRSEIIAEMNQLNMTTLAELCRFYGESMRERGHGSILNVGSTASYIPIPGMANYAATKAYVASFTVALRSELIASGVQVTLLNPGPTLTEFGARAADGVDFLRRKPGVMSASIVAQAGIEGLFAGDAEVIPGKINQLLPLACRILPRSLVTTLARLWARHR